MPHRRRGVAPSSTNGASLEEREKRHILIGNIYRAGGSPELWPQVLDEFTHFVGSASSFVACHALDLAGGRIVYASGLSRKFTDGYASISWGNNSWFQRLQKGALQGAVYRDTDLFSEKDFVARSFRDFLRPAAAWQSLIAVLARTPSRLKYLCVARRPDQPRFTDRDVASASVVVSHMARSLALYQDSTKIRYAEQGVMIAFDNLLYGVVVVDHCGRPVAKNKLAQDILARRDGIVEGSEGIEVLSHNRRMPLRHVLREWQSAAWTGGERRAETLVVHRKETATPLSVSIIPLSDSPDYVYEQQGALIFIADPERPNRANTDLLQRAFGLTPAEARLTALIAAGHRLTDAANISGTSVGTARTHLKRIFDKTGAKRQVDLVRIAVNCAAPVTMAGGREDPGRTARRTVAAAVNGPVREADASGPQRKRDDLLGRLSTPPPARNSTASRGD